MSDMDETGQTAAFEEDPAAAFLAREQDELAGIAEDTLGGVNAPPTGDLYQDFTGQAPAEGFPDQPAGDFFQEEEQPPAMFNSDPYAVISQMDEVGAEPECIKKWRTEQSERLAEKDAEENTSLAEMREQASKEVKEWYNRYEEQLGLTKASNREAEAVIIEERDSDIPGHEWERVARLCDFNPKSNKNTKDVSRMRSIFLQLKQTPLVRD